MQDPNTQRYYCRVWEALTDAQLLHLHAYLDSPARAALASTCKRLHALVQSTRKKGDQRRSTFAVEKRSKSPVTNPKLSPALSGDHTPPPRPQRDAPHLPTAKSERSGLTAASGGWVSGSLMRSAPKKLQDRSHSLSDSNVAQVGEAGNVLAPLPLAHRGKSPRPSPRISPASSPPTERRR